MVRSGLYSLYAVFVLAIILNLSFWMKAKHVREAWANVPVAPNEHVLSIMAFGDDQIAYRMTGYFLQNLGSSGGRFEPLQDYNYADLEDWLFLSHHLDPYSNYIPYMAAYYFSASQNPQDVRYLLSYLDTNGNVDRPQKWRWSAQAVYLAQFVLEDYDLALKIADKLALRPEAANWAKQLPAFIQIRKGDKQAAYGILLSMLQTEGGKLAPEEINTILDVICKRTLDKDDALQNPLCQNID